MNVIMTLFWACLFTCFEEENTMVRKTHVWIFKKANAQSQEWPVRFDLNGELVVWEKDDDFWDGLPLDWTLDGVQGEESLAILDAMEDEFHRDKMIARQKTKGKRELLNLKSSINYGVASAPSKRGKGKALM
jgi:hypothetical protein